MQNKKTKKINKVVLIVVLVIVVAFGIGQFFAYSNFTTTGSSGNVAQTTSSPTQAHAPTQVITYMPPMPASSTSAESGSCWTNSIAVPYRTDAWRCSVGNGIHDPCFQIEGSTSSLACDVNPAQPESTSTFVLKLTKPLPKSQPIPTSTLGSIAWLIQLEDGTLCTPFTGTLPPVTDHDQTANYDCAPGPLGQEAVIFGSLNNSSNVWFADVGSLSTGTSTFPPIIVSSSSVAVKTVWQ